MNISDIYSIQFLESTVFVMLLASFSVLLDMRLSSVVMKYDSWKMENY